MDTELFLLINRGLGNQTLDPFVAWITNWWFVLLLGILALGTRKDGWRVLIPLALALVAVGLSDGIGSIVKDLVGRVRPCRALEGVRLVVGCGKSGSFPSNHAANAAAAAAVFALWIPGWPRRIGLGLTALAVALSRVYLGVHYPGDVVAGAFLGGFTGAGVFSIGRRRLEDAYRIYPERTAFGLVLFCVSAFRLIYIAEGPLDLAGDEAHYWEWSRRLDWSYYSKGPFIAYWLRGTTALFGPSELGVRVGAVLFSAGTAFLLFDLGRRLYDSERAGLYAALLFLATPAFFVYGIVMSIDPPFLFFWTLVLWLLLKDGTDLELSAGRWIVLGAVVGIGFLAKYTMVMAAGCIGLALWITRDFRALIRPGPLGAVVTSVVFLAPVIIWNAGHDWVTFRHTAGQAGLGGGMRFSLETLGNFLGSQFAVLGPLSLPLLLWAVFEDPDRRRRRILLVLTVPILVFFLLKACQAKVQGNWPLPGYIALFLPLGAATAGLFRRPRPWLVAVATSFSLVLLFAILSPDLVHRAGARISGQDKMLGWKELARRVDRVRRAMPRPATTFIGSNYYMISSELAFYMKKHPVTYYVNTGRKRMNQYDLWPGPWPGRQGWDAVFVIMGTATVPDRIALAFERTETETVTVGTEVIRRTFTLVRAYGFRGFPPLEVRAY